MYNLKTVTSYLKYNFVNAPVSNTQFFIILSKKYFRWFLLNW